MNYDVPLTCARCEYTEVEFTKWEWELLPYPFFQHGKRRTYYRVELEFICTGCGAEAKIHGNMNMSEKVGQ